MATESPEQAALATSDPTPTHHDGGHSIGNKLKTGVKSGLDRIQH